MSADAWCQLVHLIDMSAPEVEISMEKFVIGRNPGCDLPHPGNKLVSGKHCYIERDGEGKVWLYDTSTNGTLLNLKTKISKGECRQLSHGDEIYIVFKKDEPEQNIGYMYQDKSILSQAGDSDSEDDATQDYTQEADQTLADALVNDISSPESSPKRKRNEDDEEKRPKKSQKLKQKGIVGSTATKLSNEKGKKEKAEKPVEEKKEDKTEKAVEGKGEKSDEPDDSAIMESLICIICQELLHDCISLQPCMHSFCAGCYSEWMERSQECPSCRTKVERINKNHLVNNLVEAFLKGKPTYRRSLEDLKELDAKNKITRDMLYPGKTRGNYDDDDDDDRSASGYSDEEDSESLDNPTGVNLFNNNANTGLLFGLGTPVFGVTRPPNVVCRQCPNFHNTTAATNVPPGAKHLFSNTYAYIGTTLDTTTAAASASTSAASTCGGNTTIQPTPGPSTSTSTADQPDPDAKVIPGNPPDFVCQRNQNHVLCLCCMLPMPEKRAYFRFGGELPPQQCYVCFRAYCHAYWGCLRVDCMGCLGYFREMNFGKKCLTGIVLDNAYESEVFKNYLDEKGISVKQVFAECLRKVDSRKYTYLNQNRISVNGVDRPVCYTCGLQAFKELAYQYRRDIPRDQLPPEVTARPNCYWGKHCRTQRNKPEHAQRFNHICEQTRTT